MDYNDKLEALEREQSELRQMIGEGITFDVEVTYTRRKPGLLGFFRKREKITEKKVFRVQEPTLATLDRLSALWLQMSIDETKLGDEDYFKTAKKMAAQEARKLAQVVAVAVLGEDYYDVTDKGGYLVRKPNETRLARLTSLFLHTVPFRFTPNPSVYVPFLETYALGVASSLFCASITALYFSIASSLVAVALARNIIASTNLELLLTNNSSASFASRTEKPNSLNLSALFCTHFSRSFSDPLRLIHSVCNAR